MQHKPFLDLLPIHNIAKILGRNILKTKEEEKQETKFWMKSLYEVLKDYIKNFQSKDC